MIVDALDRGIGAAVVDALHGGAAQDAAIGQALELRLCRLHPIERGTPVDLVTLREQPPAKAEILLAQDHPRAGSRGGECRRQTRGPAADHQHVAKGVGLFIVIRVRRLRCAAEPRGAADGRLVELLPEGGRPHEGLVVEAGAEDRREDLVRRQQVEPQRRPAILARRGKPVIKLDGRGPGVRLAPRTRPQFDQRVRLLGPRRQDSARTMIFERTADQTHAVGEESRGERIALEARELLAVEAEADGLRPIDHSTLGEPVGLGAHVFAPSPANSTATISCVVMLRVTTSQAWQPAL